MFFYVDDIIFAFKTDRRQTTETLINQMKKMFECRELDEIIHFLEIKMIIRDEISLTNEFSDKAIYLMQNAYMNKLVKDYE